jgi:hypothetical protein
MTRLTDVHYQLLNTFSNLGGTWPRYFVLKGVDYFTVATCEVPCDMRGAGCGKRVAVYCADGEEIERYVSMFWS